MLCSFLSCYSMFSPHQPNPLTKVNSLFILLYVINFIITFFFLKTNDTMYFLLNIRLLECVSVDWSGRRRLQRKPSRRTAFATKSAALGAVDGI